MIDAATLEARMEALDNQEIIQVTPQTPRTELDEIISKWKNKELTLDYVRADGSTEHPDTFDDETLTAKIQAAQEVLFPAENPLVLPFSEVGEMIQWWANGREYFQLKHIFSGQKTTPRWTVDPLLSRGPQDVMPEKEDRLHTMLLVTMGFYTSKGVLVTKAMYEAQKRAGFVPGEKHLKPQSSSSLLRKKLLASGKC